MIEVTSTAAVPAGAWLRRTGGRRTWALSAATVVLVASIIAVVSTLPRAARTSPPAHAASALKRTVTYTDPGGLFRISYPRGWHRAIDTAGGLVLQAGAQDAVSVKDFTLASRVDTHNLNDMRAVTDAILSTPTAHLTVLATQVVHVGPLSGLYYLYSFTSGSHQGLHAHYFLFSGRRMFTLVCQALPAADFPRLARTFDAVAQSLVVTAHH